MAAACVCMCKRVRELGRPLGVVPFAADAALLLHACLPVISATGRPHDIWKVRLEHFACTRAHLSWRTGHFDGEIGNDPFWAPSTA